MSVRFLAAKTRVSPLGGMIIPRLELLSALLLSKLMTSTREALQSQLSFSDPVCYTDSKVALYWIRGCNQEWKPFVENRVTSIRASVPAQHWKHCPGRENPADIPSRGMTASELLGSDLWLNGPDWLSTSEDLLEGAEVETTAPEECRQEMKSKNAAHSLLTSSGRPCIGQLIDCENFSSLDRLLRVTALVLKFTRLLCQKVQRTDVSDDSGSQYDLAPSHLLLGYRVLSLPDRTPSDDPDYDESSYDLSRRMKHVIQTSEKFWKRWSKEYLLELRAGV